jgi:hypothetical protein
LKRLKKAVSSKDTSSLLDLAFLPMYGNDDDLDKKEFVKEIGYDRRRSEGKKEAILENTKTMLILMAMNQSHER